MITHLLVDEYYASSMLKLRFGKRAYIVPEQNNPETRNRFKCVVQAMCDLHMLLTGTSLTDVVKRNNYHYIINNAPDIQREHFYTTSTPALSFAGMINGQSFWYDNISLLVPDDIAFLNESFTIGMDEVVGRTDSYVNIKGCAETHKVDPVLSMVPTANRDFTHPDLDMFAERCRRNIFINKYTAEQFLTDLVARGDGSGTLGKAVDLIAGAGFFRKAFLSEKNNRLCLETGEYNHRYYFRDLASGYRDTIAGICAIELATDGAVVVIDATESMTTREIFYLLLAAKNSTRDIQVIILFNEMSDFFRSYGDYTIETHETIGSLLSDGISVFASRRFAGYSNSESW